MPHLTSISFHVLVKLISRNKWKYYITKYSGIHYITCTSYMSCDNDYAGVVSVLFRSRDWVACCRLEQSELSVSDE